MKLQRLIIKNFRGLKGEENILNFENSNIIFLIGQNNIGKSTFLHAYDFFVNPSKKAVKEDFYNYSTSEPIEIIGEFLKEPEDDKDIEKALKKEPDWIDKWVDDKTGIVKIKKVWSVINSKFEKYTYDHANNQYIINGFGGLHTLVTKYTPTAIFINAIETEKSFEDKINAIIDKEYLKKIENLYNKEYSTAFEAISVLQEKITTSEKVDEYNTRINKNFKQVFPDLELKISQKKEEDIDITKAFNKNHSISIHKEGIERKEIFSQHGHGIIRQALFNFLTFLKEASSSSKKDYIILFEEPELYMHPKSIYLLREQLYEIAENSPFQILCATHSAGMIDISKPHSSLVRITKNKVNETTKTFQVGHSIFQSEENKNYVQMINRFNPNVCETFYTDKVLLVEGDTEAIIYRELLKKHYPENDIFVLNTGSKNNIPFFQKILTHFSIEQHILHDSDTRYLYDKKENGDYSRRTNKDGKNKKNPAWSLNEKIWNEIEISNKQKKGIAKRYVNIYNFESANNYEYDTEKGKPLSAFEYAKDFDITRTDYLVQFLKEIVGVEKRKVEYSQTELDKFVTEPNEIS